MAALSPEEENYVRMSLLVTGVSPRAVRVVFDREFAPVVLQTTIRKEYKTIKELWIKKIINQSQWNDLFPRGGSVDSKNFDASLMICLIRNLTPISVSDKLPPLTDASTAADLSRIIHYRNYMAHLTDNKIDNAYFTTAWDDITGAIDRLGGSLLKEECQKFRIASLDQSNVEIMKEVQLSRRELEVAGLELGDLKDEMRQIREERENEMGQIDPYPFYESETIEDKYKKQTEKFVHTQTTDSIMKAVKENQCVVLTSPAACGKSVNAFYTAQQLNGYGISFETDIDKMSFLSSIESTSDLYTFRDNCNWNISTIYIMDDLFGRCSFNKRQFGQWKHLMSKIKIALWRIPGIKFIITCRQDMYLTFIKKRLGIPYHHCSVQYSKEEIKQICNSYTNTDINLPKDWSWHEEIPALCSLPFLEVNCWRESPGPSVIFDTLNRELRQMRKDDVWLYKSLVLLCLQNNKLDMKILRLTTHTQDRLLTELCCGLECRMSVIKENIERSLISLTGTYVKKIERKYYRTQHMHVSFHEIEFAFANDWLFDHVAACVFIENIDLSIEYADIAFIREKMYIDSLALYSASLNNLKLNIPPEYKESYCKRLIRDLKNGNIWDALGSNETQSPDYMNALVYFLQNEDITGIKDNKDDSTILHVCSFLGYTSLIQIVIEMDKSQIDAKDSRYRCPLYNACCVGFYPVVIQLLEYLSEIRTDITEPFNIACANCHINIVRKLLQYHENVEAIGFLHRNNYMYNQLELACENGSTELLQLLLNHKAPVNHSSHPQPLHIAAFHGYGTIVKLLLQHGATVDTIDKEGFTPLCIASSKGHLDTVKVLLENFAAINYNNCIAPLPLYAACKQGFEKIVNLLLEHNAAVDMRSNYNTSLGIACHEGHAKIVELLLNFGADYECCFNSSSALHVACQNLNPEKSKIIKMLLQKHVNVNGNASDSTGSTPLSLVLAQIVGNKLSEKIAELLIRNGASVNHPDRVGYTPLYNAIVAGEIHKTDFLIQHNAHLGGFNPKTHSPLNKLCSLRIFTLKGHLPMVKLLLEKLEPDVNFCDEYGFSALTAACKVGNSFCVDLLIRHEIDINRCDDNGIRPLYIACLKNHTPVVELLLKAKVDVHGRSSKGSTALHAACLPRDVQIEPFIAADDIYKRYDNSQYKIVQKKIITNLLQHGADINRGNDENVTPLYIACDTGDCGLVGILLSENPKLNVKTSTHGFTPLHVACMNNKANIVARLLTHIADKVPDQQSSNTCLDDGAESMDVLNQVDNNGRTSLNIACQYGYEDIVDILFRNRAAIYKHGRQNDTALFTACQYNHIRIVRRLLRNGAEVNQACVNKSTPLHIACTNGDIEIVKVLLHYGADVTLADENGFTPLHIASSCKHVNIEKLLSETGSS